MTRKSPLVRAAMQVHCRLGRAEGQTTWPFDRELDELLQYFTSLRLNHRRLAVARGRGWQSAAHQIRQRLLGLLAPLQYHLQQALAHPIRSIEQGMPILPRAVLEDLRQLSQEFDDLAIDLRQRVISVTTDSLVLEEVVMGRFQIALHLDRLDRLDVNAFRVVALDPNPCEGDSGITHPHVRDDRLCAGDATLPIQLALRQGRIADAFLLIGHVLSTYNPGSAYVSLDDWSGTPCGDCGARCNREGLYYCPSCGSDFCERCIGSCDACEESQCQGCLRREGGGSGRWLCENCRQTCIRCHEITASDEADEGGLCRCCQEQEQRERKPQGDDEEDPNHERPEQPEQPQRRDHPLAATPPTAA